MSFMYILSLIAIVFQVCFITVAVAAGLYYIAELVEEYTVIAKKTISWLVVVVTSVYIFFIFFDHLPWSMVLCGLAAQAAHGLIMANFPYVKFASIPFIGAVTLLLVNHYLAFDYFTQNYFNFTEVLGYFTICLWVVPFALFVSLNANDNVLPTINERSPLLNDNDLVTNYFSSRDKKMGLLSLFNYVKETIMPNRIKKAF